MKIDERYGYIAIWRNGQDGKSSSTWKANKHRFPGALKGQCGPIKIKILLTSYRVKRIKCYLLKSDWCRLEKTSRWVSDCNNTVATTCILPPIQYTHTADIYQRKYYVTPIISLLSLTIYLVSFACRRYFSPFYLLDYSVHEMWVLSGST